MVRKYEPKNRYCRNTKLNEHQFKQVVYRLFNLDTYETIAEKEGVSANTVSKLALRLNARITGDKALRDSMMLRMQRGYPDICGKILELQNEHVPEVAASFWHCMFVCPNSFQPDHRSQREVIRKYYPHAPINAQDPAIMDDYSATNRMVVTVLCDKCVWTNRLGVTKEAKDELLYMIFQSVENHRLSPKAAQHHLWRFYIASCIAYRATRLMLNKHPPTELGRDDIDSTRFMRASFNDFVNNLFNLLIADPL
jgi:hypothetical protein